MSRKPRHFVSGRIYHLISRFVDREWFINTERERSLYEHLLGAALSSSDWRCLAFAIMSNHIHLAMIAGADRLDSWIRRVHSPFAVAMNHNYERIGSVFVRGPKSLDVDASGVGHVIAYIHNNPVRASVVATAKQSPWTSHRAYLGIAPPAWLHVQEGLALARFGDPNTFDEWVMDPSRREYDEAYEVVLAANEPPPYRARPALEPSRIVAETAVALGISLSRLRSHRRGEAEVVGRAAAVYCADRVGIGGAEIARALGVTQQAVSKMRGRAPRNEAVAIGEQVFECLTSGAICA
jgi:REP element-mobilizing transposase RayT